ncbi:MAG: hypothetical protein A3B86_03885 [Candidatus Yanofskybacteria bacterium RIFCSPHIGHO2_02_FULL_38_22b]|uniref:PKD domain-containing protein n=1 Tax=Candidatus Yanofskybacteria bacterium RIFCSPHIGHO2_02_FULL_38_22b TaxID=1802673 RepID=A0A1F8EZC7_9BACT|nr:MAG: hypothetical protein A2816_01650 [Candidatus Yanofskybacteria bacterium RIFCSPHIGHO2_01_FULL_39_44]OGN06231.1 MAG: hypothetical protein A3B86_03885 [Candidatus Yanofskybacteria bacterium RIFCSPHIGHO2_02_FULL_38_22b]OGN19650.1 MAG: hypothetical protein A2910_03615 [Candidatus Yanofskybacteria bacterium RIFCSPLOWO2_01_FULL_39_28]
MNVNLDASVSGGSGTINYNFWWDCGYSDPTPTMTEAEATCGALTAPPSDEATGGTKTYSGGYVIHTFTGSGTFNNPIARNIEYLVVGGGGGGGWSDNATPAGGGGGAGGMSEGSMSLSVGIQPITIGSGGSTENNGGDSSLGPYVISKGGGGGPLNWTTNLAWNTGKTGGSASGGVRGAPGGSGIPGQGNNGGSGFPNPWGGGGGGGKATSGSNAPDCRGGDGGIGKENTIDGTSKFYAGGGGGGGCNSANGSGNGGTGGGGGGGVGSTGWAGIPGTDGRGGGGGGGAGGTGVANPGGRGGSGIVIIRYVVSSGSCVETPGVGYKCNGSSINPVSTLHTYSSTGVYRPIVLVERGADVALDFDTVTLTSPSPTASNVTINKPNYCQSGPGGVVSWTYSDPNTPSSPQNGYRVQVIHHTTGSVVYDSCPSGSGCGGGSSTSNTITSGLLGFNQQYRSRVMVWNSLGLASSWADQTSCLPNDPDCIAGGARWLTPLHAYPAVDFTFFPANPAVGTVVTFTDATIFDSSSTAKQWDWNFGGGAPGTASGQGPHNNTYSADGSYNVTLTASDNAGFCAKIKTINIQKPLPKWREVLPR